MEQINDPAKLDFRFNDIREKISMKDLVSEYIELTEVGDYLKGNCLDCNFLGKSFSVSPHKEISYCFNCHKSSDVTGFISRRLQCNQIEELEFLERKVLNGSKIKELKEKYGILSDK